MLSQMHRLSFRQLADVSRPLLPYNLTSVLHLWYLMTWLLLCGSRMQFRPLTWRLSHPYLIADRFEVRTALPVSSLHGTIRIVT